MPIYGERLARFELRGYHLNLLKKTYWESNKDCEFGSVALDCKRPFGNSDVYGDMAEIMGYKKKGEDFEPSEEQIAELNRIYFDELPIVMQIICRTGKIKLGIYEKTSAYGQDWKLAE